LGDFSGIASPPTINRLWEISIEGKESGIWTFWHAYVFSSTHGAEYRLYYWEYGEATVIEITDALSNPSVWCLNIFDHQFVSNSEDALHIHAGSPGSWMPVGLAAPASAPTVSYSGAASTGYRKYKYTYTVSTDVADRPYTIESNASAELEVNFSNGEDIEITMTPS
jgi:hypothetical protein